MAEEIRFVQNYGIRITKLFELEEKKFPVSGQTFKVRMVKYFSLATFRKRVKFYPNTFANIIKIPVCKMSFCILWFSSQKCEKFKLKNFKASIKFWSVRRTKKKTNEPALKFLFNKRRTRICFFRRLFPNRLFSFLESSENFIHFL